MRWSQVRVLGYIGSNARKAHHLDVKFFPCGPDGLEILAAEVAKTQFQRMANHGLRDGVSLGCELIADGRPDEIAAVGVESLLHQEVHPSQVDIAKVDGDLF